MKGAGWVAAIVAVVIIGNLLNPSRPAEPEGPKAWSSLDVQVHCLGAVRDRLVSPGSMRDVTTGRPIMLGNGAWRYVLSIDSQNGFGALLRTRWRCDVVNESVSITQLD